MKFVDLTGQTFGRLTVIERAEDAVTPNKTKRVMWRCKCECGNECIRSSMNLKRTPIPSCGCYLSETTSKRKLVDLTGQRFGRLTVIKRVPSKNLTKWLCRCDCGNEIEALGNNLKRGHTTSCGCYRDDIRPSLAYRHGLKRSRAYCVWEKMKGRCYCENNPSYSRYGGRGITMCDEWRENPESFIKWAYANGYREDAKYGECTVDRIDNNKGYSPENCRIVNEKAQANNRRTNRYVDFNGERMTLAQARDFLGISQWKAYHYLVEKGMTVQELIDKGIA